MLHRTTLAGVTMLILAPMAFSVIKALTPLRTFIKDAQYIAVAKVDSLYPDKPAMVLLVQDDVKGKLPFRKLPIHLKGDTEAEKLDHPALLLKRLAPDLPLVLFVNQVGSKLTAFAYTNGTWIQLVGDKTGADTAILSLTHGEPYLRRTFKGTTDELLATLRDGIAGKKKLPEPNAKEAPGFGPEVENK